MLLLVALAAAIPGCAPELPPEEQFLADLAGGWLARTQEDLTVIWGGPNYARHLLEQAARKGADLFAAYRLCLGDRDRRCDVGYLLLVRNDPRYTEFAQSHSADLLASGELQIWAAVLDKEDYGLSQAYRTAMVAQLEQVEAPFAQFAVAKEHMRTGSPEVAVRRMLGLLAAGTPWDPRVFRHLNALPEPLRAELLLPYLDSRSAHGAWAAALLAGTSAWRTKGLAYLQDLVATGDPACMDAARQALEMVAWAEQTGLFPSAAPAPG